MENLVESPEKQKILRLLAQTDTTYSGICATVQGRKRGAKYRRTRQAAWDRRNLRTVSTHLKVEEARKLQLYCQKRGISQYYLIRRLLLKLIAADKA